MESRIHGEAAVSTPIRDTFIQIGRSPDPALIFMPDCSPGDWRFWGRIGFQNRFPSDNVKVVVTTNDVNVDPAMPNCAAVGIVAAVDRGGFDLWARNSDCSLGEAGFYFMAVEELGQPAPGEPVDLRLGVVQSKHFCPDCKAGDWNDWMPQFSTPLPPGKERVALVTGCNLNVRPFGPGLCGPREFVVGSDWGNGGKGATGLPVGSYYYNVPAVGISRSLDANGFQLSARNACCMQGGCAFYYVAAVEGVKPQDPFVIDSGIARVKQFKPSCQPGSAQSWEVSFKKPFATPPMVLVTCMEIDPNHRVAVVGLAQDITTHGFTLAGVNSDCGSGHVGFYWVAIGCGFGCG
jgi:H-type lectin domain-containing protein